MPIRANEIAAYEIKRTVSHGVNPGQYNVHHPALDNLLLGS
jgi:hypothetical protein